MKAPAAAAGYIRVSTQEQADKGTSVKEQERKIRAYCKERKFSLYRLYTDAGFSGSSMDNRPDWQSLYADAKEGRFGAVVFTAVDRVARNLREYLNVHHDFQEELKLEVCCIENPETNLDPQTAKVLRTLHGLFAEIERETTGKRTKEGRMSVWKKGQAPIGNPAYAFTWNKEKNQYETTSDKEAETVKRIYSMYLDQGFTTLDIALQLSKERIPTPGMSKKRKNAGKLWDKTTVKRILKNPAYTGEVYHNRPIYEQRVSKEGKQYTCAGKEKKNEDEWIRVEFPKLIEEERWNLVQQKMEHNKRKVKKRHEGHEDHFLAENLVFCGHCGAKMVKRIKTKKNRKTYYYYVCYWKVVGSKELQSLGRKRCILKSVDAEKIDESVYFTVCGLLCSPGKFAKDWLRDIDIENKRKLVHRLREDKKKQTGVVKRGFQKYMQEEDPELRELFSQEMEKEKKILEQWSSELKRAEQELEFGQNKVDLLRQYQEGVKSKDPTKKRRTMFRTIVQFRKFLNNLPFQEKKRITEAVFGVDGRCEVRYAYDGEIIKADADGKIRKRTEGKVGKYRMDLDPIVEMNFHADLTRTQAVINSLDREELLRDFNPGAGSKPPQAALVKSQGGER